LFGVSELERRWLEQRRQADVRLYVVWVPMLGAEEGHVPEASRLASDPRVRQYWDGGNVLGAGYRPVLGLDDTVWDVYLLYGPHQVWDEAGPPKPVFWMHQLHGITQAPTLDATKFAREADRLIRAVP
jgi:hypothetical protein